MEKTKTPRNALGNRCEKCLTPASRGSLAFIQLAYPTVKSFGETGICGCCGDLRKVWDVPHLLSMHYRGLMRTQPSGRADKAGVLNALRAPIRARNGGTDIALHRKMVEKLDQARAAELV